MKGLVADAVHRTACLEYDTVAVQMKLVADYYTHAAGVFTDTLPEVFFQPIRARLKGKALETWLQSEIYASASEPGRLPKARGLSALCIEEFTSPEDKAVQYQYRCQLETIAHDFLTARKDLAKSLDIEDNSHHAIALQILNLDGCTQGYALLHWLRLGTIAYLSGNNAEWVEFIAALLQQKLLNSSWCRGKSRTYPTHGILRRVALIESIQGKTDMTTLNKLRKLQPLERNSFIFVIIQCAAHAETAAFLWNDSKLKTGDRLGLQQLTHLLELLRLLEKRSGDMFPQVYRLTQSWLKVVKEILADDTNAKGKLLKLGMQIGY